VKTTMLPAIAALAAAGAIAVAAQAGETMSKKPPLIPGYAHGRSVTYLLTDVSTRKDATALSKKTGYPVTYVPKLNRVPEGALAKLYLFMNGVRDQTRSAFSQTSSTHCRASPATARSGVSTPSRGNGARLRGS